MDTRFADKVFRILFVFVFVACMVTMPNTRVIAQSLRDLSMVDDLTVNGEPFTARVSVDSAGVEGDHDSYKPSISADGRYVAFHSRASNLVPGDTNSSGSYNAFDIFVHDLVTGTTTRVSVDSTGAQADNNSWEPSISADGRYVAFWSEASNLVPDDRNGGASDVFVHDRLLGTTSRVSVSSTGAEGNLGSGNPSISADGRYIAFDSVATNLVSSDANGASDIFIHDRLSNTTNCLTCDSSEGPPFGDHGFDPSISADGRFVAFWSDAPDLVPGDTNQVRDVFVYDTILQTTTRASIDSAGTQGNGGSSGPSISADGRYVAFGSYASNLVADDTNGMSDIFAHDTVLNTTTRVSVDSAGAQADSDSWEPPSISADGRYVAFWSYATNLVADDTNGMPDIFMRDTVSSATALVSLDSANGQGNLTSGFPSISADGRYVAFESESANLVPNDTNNHADVFVRARESDNGVFDPWLEVWYPEDRVQVVDWPLSMAVTLTIDNDFDTSNGFLYQQDYGRGTEERISIELAGIFNIEPGQIVTVSDGQYTRFHQVTSLLVSGWDVANNTVFGSAAPNSFLQIHASNDGGTTWAWRSTTADDSGNWVFEFSEPGTEPGEQDLLDIKSGTQGAATQPGLLPGEGGQTHFAFTVGQTIPAGTSLTTPSHGTATSGTPTVYMNDPLTISTTGCSGGMATATLMGLEEPGYEQSITLDEIPAGTYTGTFAPALTYHGLASISIAITGCTPATTITFELYIDPSGVVRDTLGNPLVRATVTLYRSDEQDGLFIAVPDGSAIMSPGNRVNPDLTGAGGLFGWDVVAGFYKVRAEKSGCFSPTDPAQTFVESAVLTIPPPVTDLELILKCQGPPVASAGGPYTVEWGGIVMLDGSGSTDPNNDIAFYEWDLDGDGQYDDASGVTSTVSFQQAGDHTIGLRVTDDGGLSDTDTTTVTVLPWILKGFYQPVDMNGVYNIIKTSSTVSMKFEIFAGPTELTDPTYIKSLTYALTTCDSDANTDNIEATTKGATSLRYDAQAGQYIYNWKTPKAPGKCYQVTMTTMDGSSLVAYFQLK